MIPFSVTKEYTINEDVVIDNYPEEYESFIEANMGGVEEFILHLLDQYTPEELGAEEEYSESRLF